MTLINTIIYSILIVEIILMIYLRKDILSLFMGLIGKKKEKPFEQKSEYEEVKSYVLKELNKGFAYDRIKETLLKTGWKKDIIDSVIFDIINKK